jgi:hypothetical protein
MMEKAREVTKSTYRYFQENPENPKWVEQFPSVFERRKEVGDIYEDVFEKPLYEATKVPIVIDIERKRIPLDKAIKITDEIEELVKRGFIKCSDLEVVFEEERHLIRKDYPTGGRDVEELKVDALNCEGIIKKMIEQGKGIDFLILFYPLYKKAMEKRYSHYKRNLQEEHIKSALEDLFVIDRKGNVKKQDDVRLEPELEAFDELKKKGFDIGEILSDYNLIDKTLWEKSKEYLSKVKAISNDEIVKKCILPRIKISSRPPSTEDLLSWTYLLKHYGALPKEEIWVLDAEGEVRTSKEVFLSDKYESIYQWQGFNFPKMYFLSEEYLKLQNDPTGWKDFFKETFMKGYEALDYKKYAEDNILPILKDEEKVKDLSNSQIIQYTQAMTECDFTPEAPIFVVTKEGEKERSDNELYFPSHYSPKENWENQDIITIKFVSLEYISKDDDKNIWKEFFKSVGVKENAPDEMIAEFGKAIVRKKFEKDGYIVEPYGGKHDLQAKKGEGILYIEVKSTASGDVTDVNLDSARAKFAQQQGKCYYLAKVINIPSAPYIYLLKDPANCDGVTLDLHIPRATIENYSEKIDGKHLVNR